MDKDLTPAFMSQSQLTEDEKDNFAGDTDDLKYSKSYIIEK